MAGLGRRRPSNLWLVGPRGHDAQLSTFSLRYLPGKSTLMSRALVGRLCRGSNLAFPFLKATPRGGGAAAPFVAGFTAAWKRSCLFRSSAATRDTSMFHDLCTCSRGHRLIIATVTQSLNVSDTRLIVPTGGSRGGVAGVATPPLIFKKRGHQRDRCDKHGVYSE